MATKLYLEGGTDLGLSTDIDGPLVTTATSGSVAAPTVDIATGTAPQQFGGAGSTGPLSWWFQAAAVTISGTVTFNLWASESNMSNNVGLRCLIERCGPTGTFISTIVDSSRGVEVAITTATANNWTATPTSTTLASGDQIRVRVYAVEAGGTWPASTLDAATLRYSGDVAGLGDSWIQFTETFGTGSPAAATAPPPPLSVRRPAFRSVLTR